MRPLLVAALLMLAGCGDDATSDPEYCRCDPASGAERGCREGKNLTADCQMLDPVMCTCGATAEWYASSGCCIYDCTLACTPPLDATTGD